MWRIGVLAALSIVLVVVSAGLDYGPPQPLQRLKRSPYYNDCPPPYPPPWHHRHHWPGPPPYGPPPPYWPPPPQPPPPPPQNQEYETNQPITPSTDAKSQALTQPAAGSTNEPCDKCNKDQNTAISNAKSVNGQAVAIAIAGKNSR